MVFKSSSSTFLFKHSEEQETILETADLVRFWRLFYCIRCAVAVALLWLQWVLFQSADVKSQLLLALCIFYLAMVVLGFLVIKPRAFAFKWPLAWLLTLGVDSCCYYLLVWLQGDWVDYHMLLVLPILMSGVLGSRRLSLTLATVFTLLLTCLAFWHYAVNGSTLALHLTRNLTFNVMQDLAQVVFAGLSYFALAFVGSYWVRRLGLEKQRATASNKSVQTQIRLNESIIASLTQGVLIVNEQECLRSANGAARKLLQLPLGQLDAKLRYSEDPLSQALDRILGLTLSSNENQTEEVFLPSATMKQIKVRTHLVTLESADGEVLVMIFMEDMREITARLHTEKLAGMGRLCAAVAHEIRNPLAAIS